VALQLLHKDPVPESDISRLADVFTSTIIGLKVDTPAVMDVSEYLRRSSRFVVSSGFTNFTKDLLRCIFPTLHHHLFRKYQKYFDETIFLSGDSRDRSPFVLRLTVYRRYSDYITQASMTFVANETCINDRQDDVRACDESRILAIAMSQHSRLGSNSSLAKLDRELIIIIVHFLW
jgi:hypothetical protein